MPSPTLAIANPQLGTVSRRPQSTGAPAPGAVFTRHSRQARLLGFQSTGVAFNGLVAQPLKPVAGYLRSLDLLVRGTGGSGASVAAAADGPYNVVQSFQLRDPFGQPVVFADGITLRFIDMYSGQVGFLYAADPGNLPSFSAVAAASGNFTVRFRIPLELLASDAFCSLPALNAASVPILQVQTNTLANVYSTTPATTSPSIEIRVDENFWSVPIDDPSLAPPAVGSSAQWSLTNSPQTIGSAAVTRVPLPRVGTWIHTLILIMRDSTNARFDTGNPDPIEFWIDGVPIFMEPLARRTDLMAEQFGFGTVTPAVARPAGVLVYSWRDSLHSAAGNGDTADFWIHTTPGTLLEFGGTFGTISNAPATLQVVTGECYPVDGIPYTHLAE